MSAGGRMPYCWKCGAELNEEAKFCPNCGTLIAPRMHACERVVSLEIEKAYEELRNLLFRNNCKIITEQHPKSITVEQGSHWGVSPKGVKKVIDFHLLPHDSGTRIVSTSSLSSDWITISVFGYVVGVIFSLIFWWIATDLEVSIMAKRQSFLGWLAEAFGYTGYRQALALVSLLKIISIFLVVVLIISVIIDVYMYARKDSFAEEMLRLLL